MFELAKEFAKAAGGKLIKGAAKNIIWSVAAPVIGTIAVGGAAAIGLYAAKKAFNKKAANDDKPAAPEQPKASAAEEKPVRKPRRRKPKAGPDLE